MFGTEPRRKYGAWGTRQQQYSKKLLVGRAESEQNQLRFEAQFLWRMRNTVISALNGRRIPQFALFAGVLLLVVLVSSAQNLEPPLAPPEVVLQLRTEGDQRRFRLGDVIPVKFSYSSSVTGKYFLVSEGYNLIGGHREIWCSPAAERTDSQPSLNALHRFQEMLFAPCATLTSELGRVRGCGGCNDFPLKAEATAFTGALNTYVRFRMAGRYTCYCSSAEVTTDLREAKARSALLVKSNPLVLDIVADPAWARSAALSYAETYEKSCDSVAERQGTLQCGEIANRLMYLDTPESLAALVKFFDGRNPQWGNGFWAAIVQTSFPNDALRLMASRMQEPDFQVSAAILESLAMWELKMELPDAFESADPLGYHFHSVDKLRKYVRLLGDSLSRKSPDAMRESAATYRLLAGQSYCESSPLIPAVEQQQTLAAAGSFQ